MKFAVFSLLLVIAIIFTYVDAQECQGDEVKQEDCNTCRCLKGNWACTRKFCIKKRQAFEAGFNANLPREKREVPEAADLSTTPCAPNDYFQIDCNTCYCNTDHTGYLCTDNNCHADLYSLSTTTHIPLSNDSMLIISNHGVELIENLNSNDNSLSRIPKSVDDGNNTESVGDGNITEIVDDGNNTESVDEGNSTESVDEGNNTESVDEEKDTESPLPETYAIIDQAKPGNEADTHQKKPDVYAVKNQTKVKGPKHPKVVSELHVMKTKQNSSSVNP